MTWKTVGFVDYAIGKGATKLFSARWNVASCERVTKEASMRASVQTGEGGISLTIILSIRQGKGAKPSSSQITRAARRCNLCKASNRKLVEPSQRYEQ